ncbi:MAG TPA: serine/threonine-protein kinase [Kofleriaceae bacterium]
MTTRRIRPGEVDPSESLEPGAAVGDYRILEIIGSGGFGSVYKAAHVEVGRLAAIKVLRRELASHREAVARFEREATTFSRIKHPNLVDVLGFGRLADGRPYYVMELLSGQDLATRINEQGRLTIEESISILEPLCAGLAAVHVEGVVHRDIKASNVFLHAEPAATRVVLLDFGIAKLLGGSTTELTTSHHAIGTPACMAPEQITGAEVSARTDVYALGALTYHMVTGSLPFADSSVTMMQHMHMHAHRPRVSSIVPVAKSLDIVVTTAMCRNPNDRYPTVAAFIAAVRSALAPAARGPLEHARSVPALGVHVEVVVAAELLDEPDESLLDALEAVDAEVTAGLCTNGFEQVFRAGRTALFARPFSDTVDVTTQVRAVLDMALGFVRSLRVQPGRDPRVSLCFVLRSATVLVGDEGVIGAESSLESWAVVDEGPGVFADRALVGSDVSVEELPGDLVRILD